VSDIGEIEEAFPHSKTHVTAMKAFAGRSVLSIIVGHLASAPRVQKEAGALRAAGARVIVRGNWSDPRLADEDLALARELDIDFAAVTDLRRSSGKLGDRLRHRLANEGFNRLGLASPRTLGHGGPELLHAARQIKADLTMVHSEPGLWIGRKLLGEGHRVGVDFEDWFSHDLSPEDRRPPVRTELQGHERFLLRHAHCCLTTTRVLAEALARDAGTPRVPAVVRNCFPAIEPDEALPGVADPVDWPAVSFYWFSQTIGPGRGLETLAQALPLLRGDWRLNLRGSIRGYGDWFTNTFPPELRARIRCLDVVSNAELPARTRSHDVGLALEVPYCLNKELTASNKIHEYLRGGLAVIATRTRGQEEVMHASPGSGVLVAPGDPVALAAAMQRMVDDAPGLRECRLASAEAGSATWDWKRQQPILLRAMADALA
jgi:glycosyltransferase involved in cell wall biosynthesis